MKVLVATDKPFERKRQIIRNVDAAVRVGLLEKYTEKQQHLTVADVVAIMRSDIVDAGMCCCKLNRCSRIAIMTILT